jgi:TolA-binding protein
LSYCLLLFNVAITALIVFAIKSSEDEKLVEKGVEEESKIQQIEKKVLDSQNQISTDRENRLRDLNASPKELKRIDTTTTTTTTTVTEEKSDSSTKSS